MPRDGSVKFSINILEGTGEFAVSEGGGVAVTGTVRISERPQLEKLQSPPPERTVAADADLPHLLAEDVYKELRLRGYDYEGVFRGIKKSNPRGTVGVLAWEDNWISFMDTMLQFGIIGTDTRELYLPTRLSRATIDPAAHLEAAKRARGEGIVVHRYRDIDIVRAGGVEFRGLKTSLAPRRAHSQAAPKLERYEFVPDDDRLAPTTATATATLPLPGEEAARSRLDALTVILQIALENAATLRLKAVEAVLDRPLDALLAPLVVEILESEPTVRVDVAVAAGKQLATLSEPLRERGFDVDDRDPRTGALDGGRDLALAADVLARHGPVALAALVAALGDVGALLLEEPRGALDRESTRRTLDELRLDVVARQTCDVPAGDRDLLLLRRRAAPPQETALVRLRGDDYSWVEPLRAALKEAERRPMRVLVVSEGAAAATSGALGLATCLRAEPGGAAVRLFLVQDETAPPFSPEHPTYAARLRLDLATNVLRAGTWGGYRHLRLPATTALDATLRVEHAYIDTTTRGDLSSLRWIESPLRFAASRPDAAGIESSELCTVYYAPLNFRDIMLATGKLPPDALPGNLAGQVAYR